MADTFNVLIATDNHLGYMEKDPIRGNDSIAAFEEILQLAQTRKVDFILLGGDLFHDNKPSRYAMHRCMALLRQYCLGDTPCRMDIVSDQSENFPSNFSTVNYQDPNYNISMPVFSIHGNHDDPSGQGNLCALDMLAACGLVNYFGKQLEVDKIQIKPILLQKGTSKLALYGLGNIRDERLSRTFQSKNVTMFRPTEDTDEWFNLLVLHQNRIAHSANNYVAESYLDDFLHLVLWGHEHECKIEPDKSVSQGYFITQPGSSVATSLCEGEAVEKYIGILTITGEEFCLEKVRLKSVRPFVMETVILSKIKNLPTDDKEAVNEFLEFKVNEMIEKARKKWQSDNPDSLAKDFPRPLIRLKVDYSDGFTTFSPHKFASIFIDKIANPKDLIQFFRKRVIAKKAKPEQDQTMDMSQFFDAEVDETMFETLITQQLTTHKLSIFPELELSDVVSNFVLKQEKDAIASYLHTTLEKTMDELELTEALDDDKKLEADIRKIKEIRTQRPSQGTTNLDYNFNHFKKTINVDNILHVRDDGFEDEKIIPMNVGIKPTRSKSNDYDESISSAPPTRKKAVRGLTSKIAKADKNFYEESKDEDIVSWSKYSNEIENDLISDEDSAIEKASKAKKVKNAPARIAAPKKMEQSSLRNWGSTQDNVLEEVSVEIEDSSAEDEEEIVMPTKRKPLINTASQSQLKKQKTLPKGFGIRNSGSLRQNTIESSNEVSSIGPIKAPIRKKRQSRFG